MRHSTTSWTRQRPITEFDKIYARFYTTNDVEVHNLCSGVNKAEVPTLLDKWCDASIMIIRNGVNTVLNGVGTVDDLLIEQQSLNPDKHYWDTRRSKVLNKRARFNLCFGDQGQEAQRPRPRPSRAASLQSTI